VTGGPGVPVVFLVQYKRITFTVIHRQKPKVTAYLYVFHRILEYFELAPGNKILPSKFLLREVMQLSDFRRPILQFTHHSCN
jgi:hypothetical protein